MGPMAEELSYFSQLEQNDFLSSELPNGSGDRPNPIQ
jgi:hypothetical protein